MPDTFFAELLPQIKANYAQNHSIFTEEFITKWREFHKEYKEERSNLKPQKSVGEYQMQHTWDEVNKVDEKYQFARSNQHITMFREILNKTSNA